MKRAGLILMLCAGLLVAGCGDDSGDESTSTSTATSAESAEKPQLGTKPEVTVPEGPAPKQLVEKDLVVGDGAAAKAGDEVTVQYVGVGYESGEEFDASWDRGEPFTFPLGAGEVIKGWDQGVVGMKEGGRRELIIPPSLAYGPAGSPPVIGPNETLVFVVDLVSVN